MAENAPIPPALFLALHAMPVGIYRIFYDIYTRRTEDDLPAGWNAARSTTYTQIAHVLENADFRRIQHSDWASDNCDAMEVYWTMLNLRLQIRPPGRFETTVKGLKAHYIPRWEFDITEHIQLGGAYSQNLRGPTPVNLVPPNVLVVPVVPPFFRPVYTTISPNALNPNNWREHPF